MTPEPLNPDTGRRIRSMRDDRTLIDLVVLTQDLSALLGRPVDVVSEDGRNSAGKDEILAEAVAL